MLKKFRAFYGGLLQKFQTGWWNGKKHKHFAVTKQKAECNFLNRNCFMFLHLPNLVMLHHSSAGVGEGNLFFLAPTKTTAGQKQIKILVGLTKS